jgi:agmatine deiminase
VPEYDVVNKDTGVAAQLRMPPEWAAHDAVWLQWPTERMRGYPGYAVKLESIWLEMTRLMHTEVRVRIAVSNEEELERLGGQLRHFGIERDRIDLYVIPTDDVWARDNGPIFVFDADGHVVVTSWNFNGWGGRFAWNDDRAVPAAIADLLGLTLVHAPITTEGGAIEVDGAGTLIATRSSILNPNRNPHFDRQDVERAFRDTLGIRHVVWLTGAPPEVCEALGDVTDYHVDIAARFTPAGTVLYCDPSDPGDPRYAILAQHRADLQGAVDARGRAFDLVPLPTPRIYSVAAGGLNFAGSSDPWQYTACSGRFTDAAYTNYLVTNNLVLVPVYGCRDDERAKSIIAEHFPGRHVVGIPTLSLTEEGGAIHCVTQQQPKRPDGGPIARTLA